MVTSNIREALRRVHMCWERPSGDTSLKYPSLAEAVKGHDAELALHSRSLKTLRQGGQMLAHTMNRATLPTGNILISVTYIMY